MREKTDTDNAAIIIIITIPAFVVIIITISAIVIIIIIINIPAIVVIIITIPAISAGALLNDACLPSNVFLQLLPPTCSSFTLFTSIFIIIITITVIVIIVITITR